MNIRLVPLVLFAVTSLLTLKAFDMVFNGEALLIGAKQAYAEEAKAAEKAETKTAEAPAKPEEKGSLLEGSRERPKEKIVLPKGEESSETVLNERLGEKRRQLEDRAKELDLRENLMKAAEKKLDERTADLKAREDKLQAIEKAKEEQAGLQIKSLVLMYETMKPKEAAAIFDKLDMNVLIEVASRMKPQVTAAVLAKMPPDSAQKLTTELARRGLAQQETMQLSAPAATLAPQPSANANELPRIDKPPAKSN